MNPVDGVGVRCDEMEAESPVETPNPKNWDIVAE